MAKRHGSHGVRKRVIAVPMVARRPWLALLAGAVLVTACERSPTPAPEDSGPPTPSELLPVADPPLDRERVLIAVARAASDFAAGRDDGARQRDLAGRRFEVRLRFGCEGDAFASRQWSFDERRRVLRVRVEPELSGAGPAIAALGLEGFEAVEGFWIRRPWLLQAACPVRREAPEAEDEGAVPAEESEAEALDSASEPRIGIAHFFSAQDSRTLRRDSRAYEATVQLAEGEQPSAAGYDLVLSGRLARLPDGRVIACSGEAALTAPRCIVSVDLDRVELARPDGTRVAEWSSG